MPRLPRTLLIPALGLALTFGAAVWVSLSASKSPGARLHGRIAGYLTALFEGDARVAAQYWEDGNPAVEARRAEALRGVTWFLAAQRIRSGPPREAHARVLWLSDEEQILREEVQAWRPGPGGTWLLWALDGGAPGPRR